MKNKKTSTAKREARSAPPLGSATFEARRKEFEHATWKRVNSQKYGGNWPVLYDAGELGFCLLDWTGAFGGHWKNQWFDKAETLPESHTSMSAQTKELADVVIYEKATRKIDSIIGTNMKRWDGYTYECLCQVCGRQFKLANKNAPHRCGCDAKQP